MLDLEIMESELYKLKAQSNLDPESFGIRDGKLLIEYARTLLIAKRLLFDEKQQKRSAQASQVSMEGLNEAQLKQMALKAFEELRALNVQDDAISTEEELV
jgi:hypothetical protein